MALSLGTSPAGIEYDAQVTNEGAGVFGFAGQTSGSGGGLNVTGMAPGMSLLPSATLAGVQNLRFHSVHFAFPIKASSPGGKLSAEYPAQQRGCVLVESCRGQFNLYRVSMAGTLEGLEVPTRVT